MEAGGNTFLCIAHSVSLQFYTTDYVECTLHAHEGPKGWGDRHAYLMGRFDKVFWSLPPLEGTRFLFHPFFMGEETEAWEAVILAQDNLLLNKKSMT